MKRLFFASLVCLAIVSCGNDTNNPDVPVTVNMDAKFDAYKSQFIENLWKTYPGWASSQGYHKYDSVLVVPDDASRAKELAFAKEHLDSLKSYDLKDLSDNNKTDYHMIENQLRSIEWSVNEQKSYEWDPSQYNVCGAFAEILNGNYDSADVRLRNFYLKMANIQAYYEAAKKNIKNPTVEHTQLAIDQNLGGISVFETDFHNALNALKFGEHEKQSMEATAKQAVAAIRDYAEWLKKLDNKTPRSFRLGKELYEKKFEFDIQSGYTAEQIFAKAVRRKNYLHTKMYVLTQNLWHKYLSGTRIPDDSLKAVRMMIDKISLNHVAADSFQSAIEHQ